MTELFGGASALGWVALKATLLFALTVVGLRLGERRTLAQLGTFDFAAAVAVGAIIGRTSTSSTTSFATGAVALVTLLVAHRLVSVARRYSGLRRTVDQQPRLLIDHGEIAHDALNRSGLTPGDLYSMLRQQHILDLDEVDYALYETRGGLSLLRHGDRLGSVMRDGLVAAGHPEPRQ